MADPNRYATLKRYLLASMILVPLIPFILSVAIGYYYFTSALENGTRATVSRILSDHRLMIEDFLKERLADLKLVQLSQDFYDLIQQPGDFEIRQEPRIIEKVFKNLQDTSMAFTDLGVFNEDGIHVAYHGPFELKWKEYGHEPWFRKVMADGYYISNIFLGFRKVPHFVVAVAREVDGKKWVLRATIDSMVFNNLVGSVRIGATGEAYILSSDGVFQTERRSGGKLLEPDPDFVKYPGSSNGDQVFMETDHTGEAYLYATTWMKDNEWMLVVRQQKADALKSLRTAAFTILFVMVLGGTAIVIIAILLTERIVRRLERTEEEKQHLGEQLIRAGRLAELGEMAAGFAHEINNPLQIIKSEQALIETILQDFKANGTLEPSDDLRDLEDSISQIEKQINRCSQITHAILRFGRKSEPVFQNVNLGEFIPDVIHLVENKAAVAGISIREEIAENVPMVHGDPGQLQQVVLNLLNNAMDAIESKSGRADGRVTVSVAPTEDRRVRVSVRDNGTGIKEEDRQNIFSPFFTTKPVGKGTGLGLSVCYGIVSGMGGEMSVESEIGAGTAFHIYLPMANS